MIVPLISAVRRVLIEELAVLLRQTLPGRCYEDVRGEADQAVEDVVRLRPDFRALAAGGVTSGAQRLWF